VESFIVSNGAVARMGRFPQKFLKENLGGSRLSEDQGEPVGCTVSGAVEHLVIVVAGPGIQEPESQRDSRLTGSVSALRTDREMTVDLAGVCRFQLAANKLSQGLVIWVLIHA
jgi:hypothetical protein